MFSDKYNTANKSFPPENLEGVNFPGEDTSAGTEDSPPHKDEDFQDPARRFT